MLPVEPYLMNNTITCSFSFGNSKEGFHQMITFAAFLYPFIFCANGIQFQGHRTKMAISMES